MPGKECSQDSCCYSETTIRCYKLQTKWQVWHSFCFSWSVFGFNCCELAVGMFCNISPRLPWVVLVVLDGRYGILLTIERNKLKQFYFVATSLTLSRLGSSWVSLPCFTMFRWGSSPYLNIFVNIGLILLLGYRDELRRKQLLLLLPCRSWYNFVKIQHFWLTKTQDNFHDKNLNVWASEPGRGNVF